MNMTIQEDDMYIASRYCNEYIAELSAFLVDKKRIADKEIKNCENKIKIEIKDIEVLKEKAILCKNVIDKNKIRIEKIPNEIKELENEIEDNIERIDSTPIPVYTYEYDYYSDRSRRVIDHDATRSNEDYIEDLKEENRHLKRRIELLNAKKQECYENINSLEMMTNNINHNISEKERLILLVRSNITLINNSVMFLNKEINKIQNEIDELNKKVLKCADLIHNYGVTLTNIFYKDNRVSYNSKDIFIVNSATIGEEIEIMKSLINTNNSNLSLFNKGINNYTGNLNDAFSNQVSMIANESVNELKKINDCYFQYSNILKKAQEFLIQYEMVKI